MNGDVEEIFKKQKKYFPSEKKSNSRVNSLADSVIKDLFLLNSNPWQQVKLAKRATGLKNPDNVIEWLRFLGFATPKYSSSRWTIIRRISDLNPPATKLEKNRAYVEVVTGLAIVHGVTTETVEYVLDLATRNETDFTVKCDIEIPECSSCVVNSLCTFQSSSRFIQPTIVSNESISNKLHKLLGDECVGDLQKIGEAELLQIILDQSYRENLFNRINNNALKTKILLLVDLLNFTYNRRLDRIEQITRPDDVYRHIIRISKSLDHERCWVLLLDKNYRLLEIQTVSIGSNNASLMTVGNVLKPALVSGCPSIIFVHNHPSGEVTPSISDVNLTQILNDSARLVGVKLHDHIIMGEGKCYSFVRNETYCIDDVFTDDFQIADTD